MDAQKAKDHLDVDPAVLPGELLDIVSELNDLRKNSAYIREAEYYWEQACNTTGFSERDECVSQAAGDLRKRFSNVFDGTLQ